MKKSLSKILARMAKDGDVETVAEFIEEMIGEESPAEEIAEAVEAVTETAEEPVVVEAPEAKEITIDEDTLGGIIQRLDKLIELLSPTAPVTDEDPEITEEIAEAIEEAVEAVETAEAAAPEGEEVAEILETILDPEISTTIEEAAEGDEDCDNPDQPVAKDALRAALQSIRPQLKGLNRKVRKKVCRDFAIRYLTSRKSGHYDAMSRKKHTADRSGADLGKRIMAARNANYHN